MADQPLNRLTLPATSVADDLGFVALADIAKLGTGPGPLLIGGHMVQLHAYRWALGADLYRETTDADLGLPLVVAQDPSLVDRLEGLGYRRTSGNSFAREIEDIPVGVVGASDVDRQATVDLLIPAYTSRARNNRKVADHLTTTEVLGLADAFKRPAVTVELELIRLNKETLSVHLQIPDELSALVLKVMAWRSRLAQKDAVDIWRCAEIALAASVMNADFAGKTRELARDELIKSVDDRNGAVIQAIVDYRGLSNAAGDSLHTRLRAVVARICSPQ